MSGNTGSSTAPAATHHRWRFTIVLLAALLFAVAQPLAAGVFDQQGSFDIFFSLLIIAVLLLVFEEKRHRRVAISLGLVAFCGVWASHALTGPTGRMVLIAAHVVAVCFFAYALYGILRAIFVRRLSGDAIFGVICGYVLLGIIWTLLYSALETGSPGSFSVASPRLADGTTVQPDRGILGYYSFITLATVGYGDVTPATPLARTLAWMEALVGQFYLAILVAGLVGLKVTQAIGDRTDDGGNR
jgi:voltage-gated potassium channel